MVSDSVRRLVLVVVVMIFASNGLRVSIDAATGTSGWLSAMLDEAWLFAAGYNAGPAVGLALAETCYHLAHFGQADVACTYAACLARTVGYLPVHQTRRSAAGSRSHARLDQRASVVCDPCLRSAGTSAIKGGVLENATLIPR